MERSLRPDGDLDVDLETELDALDELLPAPGRGPRPSDQATARELARRILARFGAALGSGADLPAALRARFEAALGIDLGGVRLHGDAGAAAAASALGARAFAVGQDVFFDRGELDPASADGARLIAHEVVHTVQQRSAATTSELARTRPGDATEREADELAGDLVRGAPVARTVSAAPLALAGEWRRDGRSPRRGRRAGRTEARTRDGQTIREGDALIPGTRVRAGSAPEPDADATGDGGEARNASQRRLPDNRQVSTGEYAPEESARPPLNPYEGGATDRDDSAPLFDERGANYDDVQQGELGDCYLMSALSAVAQMDPARIRRMIAPLGDGRYSVTFWVACNENGILTYNPHQEIVTNEVPVVNSFSRTPQFGGTPRADASRPGQRELWVSLVERAYAQWRGGYQAAGNGGDAAIALEEVTGTRSRTFDPRSEDPAMIIAEVERALRDGAPVTASTSCDDTVAARHGLTSPHGYSVLWAGDGVLVLRNQQANPTHGERRVRVDAEVLRTCFGQISISGARSGGEVQESPAVDEDPAQPPLPGQVQQKAAAGGPEVPGHAIHAVAARGLAGSGGTLPHADTIQRAFGRHDVSGVRAHVGGVAGEAATAIGAKAYASDERVAFAEEPDLFLIAHEVAHVIQQRAGVDLAGGVGTGGDVHEQHADEVAEAVVRGESVEALLDTYRGSAGGVQRKAVQRYGERELRARQSRQDWDRAQIDGPLAEVDSSVEEAIRANQALGFSNRNLGVLREALGLPQRPYLIERRFVQAVRRVQLGGAVVETERSGSDASGRRPADVGSSEGASGVLDLATVMRLDLSAHVSREARGSYRRAPWTGYSEAEVDDIRAHLAGPLGIGESDLHTAARGRGVEVSAHFLERAAAWQLWRYRASQHVVLGRLGSDELSDLGVGVPVRQRPPAAEPVAEEGDETASSAEQAGPAPSAAMPDEPEAEPALPPVERRLEDVRAARAELRALLGQRYRARREGDAALARADRTLSMRMEKLRAEIEALELPRTDFSGSQQYEQPHVQAQHMVHELDYILDESAGAPRTHAQQAAADAEQDTPLERRSEEESRADLAREGVVVDDHTQITHENWERRVAGGATPEATAQRGEENAQAMIALRARMEPHRNRLRAAIRASRREPDGVTAALDALAAEDFAHDPAWRPPASTESERLRRAWDPGRRPDLLTAGTAAGLDAGARVRLAGAWRDWLGGAIGELGTERGRGEIHRQRGYARSDPRRIGNADAVEVDLHRTGVTITNNAGNPLTTTRMRLDPVFADAFLRFLRQLQGLGVTEIRTAGFLRSPISPADTHPRGQACDITGFQIGDQLLHLRSGRPMDPPAEGDAAAQARYDDVRRGHSDWFDHTGQIGGMTHEEVMHAITNMMRSHFSTIVGPGNDASHMGHWHVELTSSGRTGPQVRAQMDDRDQPDFVRDRAARQAPEWETPDERASFDDDEPE